MEWPGAGQHGALGSVAGPDTYSSTRAAWCPVPAESRLRTQLTDAYYCESCSVPLRRTELRMHEIYLAILAHLPWWMRAAIMARNWTVAPLGLHAEPAARVWRTETRDAYAPGDRIVRFNVYSADPTELVAGRDDRHLNLLISVTRGA